MLQAVGAQVRQLARVQAVAHQRVGGIEREFRADAGDRGTVHVLAIAGIERGCLELAGLRYHLQHRLRAGQHLAGARRLVQRHAAQLRQRVAQRGGPRQQVVFQPRMRDAQQVVVLGQCRQAFVQVAVHGAGTRQARAPDIAELPRY
ncbi:hypothetical protein D9M72_298200 [compost metagenome]